MRIHADPLERTIVCRLPYIDISIRALSLVTGFSKQQLSFAAEKLRDRGLVKLRPGEGGYPTIVPANEKSRNMMLRLAEQWCGLGDECGVRR